MIFRMLTPLALIAALAYLSGCGLILGPLALNKAVSANANYSFKGKIVDPQSAPLEGVVAMQSSSRHFWDLMEGTTITSTESYVRVDRDFAFNARGSNYTVTFSKDGYRDAMYRFSADNNASVSTNAGTWSNQENFSVLLIPVNARDAYLVHQTAIISYEHYPIADVISLPNMLTGGAAGDVIFKNKDASDPTVLPDGTLYAVLDSAPPKAINKEGQIDRADLDIPNALTLKIPGPNSGFVRILPRTGLHPMLVSTQAPETGYAPELTIERGRLKEMRMAPNDAIADAHEFFYFRSGNRFGKGVLSWSNSGGKPHFTIELFLQRRPDTRDLTTFNYGS